MFESTSLDRDYYQTTLDACTCDDFDTRQLPCKHIYRLAFELSLLPDNAVSLFKAKLPPSTVQVGVNFDKITNFGTWDESVHTDPEQQKRAASAKKSDMTPVSVDKENQTGVFQGSGKAPYETTLNGCTCRDYFVRHLPCKHMYRLAFECGYSAEGLASTVRAGGNDNELTQSQKQTLLELFAQRRGIPNYALPTRRTPEAESLLNAGAIKESTVSVKLLSEMTTTDFKSLLTPFKIPGKSKFRSDDMNEWITKNEAVVLPLISDYYIFFKFDEDVYTKRKDIIKALELSLN
jgi:transcriptional antiterminator Rof (Rho-off)